MRAKSRQHRTIQVCGLRSKIFGQSDGTRFKQGVHRVLCGVALRLSVIAFLLIISLLLVPVNAMAAQVEPASAADADVKLGDADGDGDVTIMDATAVQRFLAELSMLSFNEAAADTDSSGDVDIIDATHIRRFIVDMCYIDGSSFDTHTHTLTYVAEVPAATTKEGTKAHYQCSVCNKLFSDKDGKNEVTADSLVIPKITQVDPKTCSHHWVKYVIPYDYWDLYRYNRNQIPFTNDSTRNTLKQTNMLALENNTGWAIYYCDKCHIADYDRFYTNQEFGRTQEEEEALSLQYVNDLRESLGLDEMYLDDYTTAVAKERAKELLIEKYRIDINYLDKVLTLEPKIEDELSALKNINKSIVSLSEQFI